MDIVVRRQSEQLNQRHFTESMDDDDDNGKRRRRKFREIDGYRRWEWSNLKVNCSTTPCFLFHFDFNRPIRIEFN